MEALLEAVTGERPASPAEALERAREIGEFFAEMVEPLLSLTLAPTMIDRVAEAERDPGGLRRGRRLAAAAGDDDRTSSMQSFATSSVTATTSSR